MLMFTTCKFKSCTYYYWWGLNQAAIESTKDNSLIDIPHGDIAKVQVVYLYVNTSIINTLSLVYESWYLKGQ